MQKTLLILCVWFVFCLYPVFPVRPQQPTRSGDLDRWEQNLRQNLEHLFKTKPYQNVRVGLAVADLTSKRIVYQHRADLPLMTASALKIIPAGVALAQWGPDYCWNTPVYTDGFVQDCALHGNLYIVGRGDPSLQLSDLQKRPPLSRPSALTASTAT
jgi:D-alanyl-D-alanine carboxypeptidase/D-alanyl-D-alanine-endopeptidase (penicillin-binding protein 4)